MRGAIYSRYSSDLQRDESIEDQIRVCKERLEKEGWQLVGTYADHAETGSNLLRPGIQSLVQDAMAGKFDVVVTEDLDRISRDQEDTAGIYKRLQFGEVEIFTLADGFITDLHVGLKSTMNAIQLKQIGQKVRRGQRGRVEAGKIPGGNAYGYRVINKLDADGNLLRGDREIIDEEAAVVVRIMEEYVTGHSPRAIAVKLNKEGIPGPSGKAWSQSTINGNRRRGNGILNNELYIGQIVYNRQRFIKNPNTGKRVARLNPEDQWVRQKMPELRIVSNDLWQGVKERQKKLDTAKPSFWTAQRPRNLFSYLLKCGDCGAGFSMISASHLGCSAARNKGTCDNRLTMHREQLEQQILGALRHHLMDPALCKVFCKEYTKELNRIRMKYNAVLSGYQVEYKKVEAEQQKLVQSILDGVPGSVLKEKGLWIEKRKAELEQLLENTEEAPTLLHPNMAGRYHEEIQRLIESLNVEEHRTEAAELIRSLIEKVTLTPNADESGLVVDLHGDLAGILSLATGQAQSEINGHLSETLSQPGDAGKEPTGMPLAAGSQDKLVAGECSQLNLRSGNLSLQDKLVAGAGFEPATFRL
ncbi:MAG: recombinase family protein [Pseudomonadota bacterium]